MKPYTQLTKQEKEKFNYPSDEEIKLIMPFVEWSEKNVKEYLFSEAHCFDTDAWVGGISDAGAELNDGTVAILDFKSAKEAYDSHFIQLGGYAMQIQKNGLWDSEGKKNKKIDKPIEHLIVVPFGAEKVIPQFKNNVADYIEGFKHCLALYRLLGMDK